MNNRLHQISALNDNYIWLLENQRHEVVIVDPGESAPVIHYLANHQLTPVGILLTHHHSDHVDGVADLQKQYPNIAVFGPNEVKLPINLISDQNKIRISDMLFDIIPVPGHTKGHLAYYCSPYLFCGDTLFSAGCGRLFEGSYEQMFDSLTMLKMLPNETVVCAAHEYTAANIAFACNILPDDLAIHNYAIKIKDKRCTLPTTLALEKQINLFLRCDDKTLQKKFNCESELALFIFFRTEKNNF